MEARSVKVPIEPRSEPVDAADRAASEVATNPETAEGPAATASNTTRRTRLRVAARVTPLPREVEYAYIGSDMRRLLAIAGILLVLMIVPLVVVGF